MSIPVMLTAQLDPRVVTPASPGPSLANHRWPISVEAAREVTCSILLLIGRHHSLSTTWADINEYSTIGTPFR